MSGVAVLPERECLPESDLLGGNGSTEVASTVDGPHGGESGAQREATWLRAVADGSWHDPATSAELVAMLAEHGLRRLPGHQELERVLRQALRRQARSRSGGAIAQLWLRVTDRSFVRNAALRHLGEVVAAVNATCGDAREVRLVGLLGEVITTQRRPGRDANHRTVSRTITIPRARHAMR